jgi:hypothetical protein
VVDRFGDYVTCQMGTSTCQSGVWGACQGNTIYTKSLSSSSLGGGGIRVQSVTQTCSDPCDPNACTETQQGPGDVDASGVSATDAGVMISPTTQSGGTVGDAGACQGLQCQVDWSCPSGSQTTLTGTVYDPAGINPLYNAYVYVPVDPSGNLPAFSTGASCDPCAGTGSFDAVAVAQTNVYGQFTLVNVPTTAKAPFHQIPLVIQMGKWRRLEMLQAVPDCQTTAVPAANSRLPRSRFDGWNGTADIPKMAIATGNVDPMQCMMLKMGVDPAEFQLPGSGTRRIDYYIANGMAFGGGTAPPLSQLGGGGSCSNNTCYQNGDCSSGACNGGSLGQCVMQSGKTCTSGSQCKSGACWNNTCHNEPSCEPGVAGQCGSVETCQGGTLGACSCNASSDCSGGATCNPGPLMGYDVVLLPCEGFEDDSNDQWATNVANYAFAGGRLFTTHYSYTYLSTPTNGTANATNPSTGKANPFFPVANWNLNDTSYGSAGAIIDTNFPKGQAFEQWMDNVGAASGASITLNSPRHDVDSVNASYATEWMHHDSSPNETFHFTFNTPLGAGVGDAGADGGGGGANVCGRVVYSDFHVSASAIVSGTTCASNADCGYGETCTGGTYGTCSSQSCKTSSDCGDPKFACSSTLGTCGCTKNSDCSTLGAGTCSGGVAANCGCYTNSDCATMGAGTCSGNAAGKCSSNSCYQDSDCTAGPGACHGGNMGTCQMAHNATCTVANQATQCKSGVCQNGQCQNEPSCEPGQANACGTAETCHGGHQGQCGCYQTADCAALGAGSCGGATAGTCSSATCVSNADCTAGSQKCVGTPKSGQCTVATCSGNSSCTAGTQVCSGSVSGTCAANSCASTTTCSATSSGQERCSGGTCNGCLTSSDCPGNGQSCQGGSTGTCTGNSSAFPGACAQGRLTPQEAALEFMLLDLTACISPDNAPPPAPPMPVTTYSPVTFTETFSASCPSGTHVVWRELDWQANIPNTASIVFSAQTAEPTADGGTVSFVGAQSVQLAKATTSTMLPAWDAALIDATGTGGGPSGAFNTASPPIKSRTDLLLTITLEPTSDMKATPTLIQWQVKSDCPPSE